MTPELQQLQVDLIRYFYGSTLTAATYATLLATMQYGATCGLLCQLWGLPNKFTK